ncbi:hypothetical protein SteCoe_7881 [Stentor coeruleus]|uniref:Uncharacterized protein n=1 Tax=Stentor coeruleus TaxID=5963 RepID=A0A1R2CLJ5_9CILI|nr:hypothetical protein SteCoe_7881 [Stentor coeruleus]
MVFGLLSILVLVTSQNFPNENKAEKFNACYYITNLKLSLEKELLDSVIQKLGDSEKVVNRISTDMLMKCYAIIDFDTAVYVIQQGENLFLEDKLDKLVKIDLESYKPEEISIGKQHMKFYEEIKKVKKDAEIAANKAPIQPPLLPPIVLRYAGIVFIIFLGSHAGYHVKFYQSLKKLRIKNAIKLTSI